MVSVKKKVLEAVQKVHTTFKKKGLTLSVAESCTGGLIGHYITSLPGASTFFKAGIVSYAEDMKKVLLGVSSETIRLSGAVSEETAKHMAERMRFITEADYAISTTGNLGPGVLEKKERGLIYIAVSGGGKTFSRKLRLKGNREINKESAALEALKLLIERVETTDTDAEYLSSSSFTKRGSVPPVSKRRI